MALADKITPLILTYNEEPNLRRTLDRLQWAKEVLVVDSYSTDATLSICQSYANVRILQRMFDTAAAQDNFGLDNVQTEWVLSMDADYVLSEELIRELHELPDNPPMYGYFIPFRYCVYGKPLRATLLPPRCSLYRRDKARYYDDGHTQRVRIDGVTGALRHHILHDDRKSLSRWLRSQDRYVDLEARKLRDTPANELSFNDRIRQGKILAPVMVFVYCLTAKGMIFDGWHGWYYTLQRTLAEILLALRLIEVDRFDVASTIQPPESTSRRSALPKGDDAAVISARR
jgi:glycosyltransferase involved in cell wall biosynthesis